jgi:hypothetical protein
MIQLIAMAGGNRQLNKSSRSVIRALEYKSIAQSLQISTYKPKAILIFFPIRDNLLFNLSKKDGSFLVKFTVGGPKFSSF